MSAQAGAGRREPPNGNTKPRSAAATKLRRPGEPRPAAAVPWTIPWAWMGRLLVAAVLALTVGYLPYHIYLRSGLSRFIGLRAELAQLEARNQKMRAGIIELRLQLERLQEDGDAVERVARDELGLVRPGEIVFKVE